MWTKSEFYRSCLSGVNCCTKVRIGREALPNSRAMPVQFMAQPLQSSINHLSPPPFTLLPLSSINYLYSQSHQRKHPFNNADIFINMADQSSPVGLASKYNFLEATIHRRSTITTKKESPIPDSRIVELVKHSILHTPSPFHVQSTRAVVLLHKDHDKLWDIAHENVEKTAPPPALYEKLITSIKLYKGAYGSVRRLALLISYPAVITIALDPLLR